MGEQIKDLEQLAGKTIERAVSFGNRTKHAVGVILTDGSFFLVSSAYVGLDWVEEPGDDSERVEFGLMTAEELRQKEADREAKERQQYERLKAKFDKPKDIVS